MFTPGGVAIDAALQGSVPLARLLERVRESRERFDAIAPLLPPPLREHVRPGPLDDEGWSLLAANGAVAAKLRQLLPRLEEALASRGCVGRPIRVKVAPRTGNPTP
jgi:hypothetical protein